MTTFSPEQLNFFKFSTVVLDEFPPALRQVFVYMWDNQVASTPGFIQWDDSPLVRNMFLKKEGGKTKYVPTNKSFTEWDCTSLFEATLFAQSFGMPDGKGGFGTLAKLYVKPRRLLSGTFHPSVMSPSGNQAETFALALDQLRLLRNTLCHQISTRKIDKAAFDHYIQFAKDAFAALGQSATKIDDIGKLGEKDFPTPRVQQLEEELRREKFKQIEDNLDEIASQVKDVGSDVKSGVRDVMTKADELGSDIKTAVTDMKTKVDEVGSDVKTAAEGVKTKVDKVGSDVKTAAEEMKTKVDEVQSIVKEVKTNVGDIKQAIQVGTSKGPFVPDSCVPDTIPHFVGRQAECQAILDHLTDDITRLVNVWGPPGFGKTSVAISVARSLQDMKMPVYFVPLRGMESKEELVSKLLSIFADASQVSPVSSSHRLIQCLQQVQNTVVLILDNADDLVESEDAKRKQQVFRLIDEILAQCKHMKLLLTTRESLDFFGLTLPIHLEKINALDEVSSASLVKLLLPGVSENDRSCIVKECGQVPLAIRLMCCMMREGNVSLNAVLEERKRLPLIEVLDSESFREDARLKSLINTSFQRLSFREENAFVSLAVFPGWFRIEEATAILDVKTELTSKKIIRSLERKGLIDCGDNFTHFTIHSLLRSFIDEKRRNDKSLEAVFLSVQLQFYDYYISSFRTANEKFLMGPSNEASAIFLDRRECILSSLANGTKDDKLYPKVVEVLSKAELFLFAVLSNEELLFERLYDIAVQEAKSRQIVEDEKQLLAAKSFRHCGWLSPDQHWDHSLYAGCNSAKLQCYHAIHQLLSGKLGEDISSLWNSVDQLSSCSDDDLLKRLVYSLLEKHFRGKDQKKVSYFVRLQNSWLEARSSQFVASYSLDDSFGWMIKEDFFLFSVFLKLRSLLPFDQNQDQNQDFPERPLLKVASKTFSNLLLSTPGLPPMLTLVYDMFRDSDVLQPLLRKMSPSDSKSFADFRSSFLEFIDQVRQSGFNSVQSYNAAKQLMESFLLLHEGSNVSYARDNVVVEAIIDTLENVLKSNEHVPGRDFVDLARNYDKLGMIKRWDNGDNNGAIDSYQQAIRVREENIGDHVDTASSLTSIGCLHFEKENASEAEKAFHRALELRKRLGVYDDADTAGIYFTLEENHFTLGNYEKALEAHLQALQLRKKHGTEHPLTARSFCEVGHVYRELRNYPEALKFCEQSLTVTLELLGEHVDTAANFNHLACIHFAMGEYNSAVQAFEVAADMTSKLLGEHENTATSYYNLGNTQLVTGNLSAALECLKEASRLRKKLLGDYNPNTAESLN